MRQARREHGFSLIEAVIVIAVIAILAGAGTPFFLDQSGARASAAARRFAADLRYAQRLALVSSAEWKVEVAPGLAGYTLAPVAALPAGMETLALDPLTQETFVVDLGSEFPGVTFASAGSITFDARGRPMAGAATFTLGATRTITVAAETGAVGP